ncbi:MAG: amylo-alpha-1,6-glucosidase, partial [Planctomycetota bacterium]
RRLVLAAIRDHLLTPVGLRTLPADDPHYHPHYTGPQFDRDGAYHRGTVWPWLLGPYAEGVLRAGKFSKKAKTEAAGVLQPLLDRLLDEGLGQLHEIHDAAAGRDGQSSGGHAPRGCPAQAWSVAEVVRVRRLIEAGQ